jgi:pyruvate-formate lyase-activating enzyme
VVDQKKRKSSLPPLQSNIECYKTLIRKAVSSNVEVILVISPQFYNKDHEQSSLLKDFKDFLKQNSIRVLDYSQRTQFIENRDLFHDIRHLNHAGAKIFTRLLTQDLQPLLRTKSE